MSQGYAAPTPVDRYGNVLPLSGPVGPAVASTGSSQIVSSAITLNTNTTVVQITTKDNPVVGKWFGAGVSSPSVTTSSFDFSVPGNWTNYQAVPISVIGTAAAGAYGTVNGLYPVLALMPVTGTVTSIMTTQYA